MRATASFEVNGWNNRPYSDEGARPLLSRCAVKKTFTGELAGTSEAELLMVQADPKDFEKGASYVGSEVFSGTLAGRAGTFVFQHGGLHGGGVKERTFGHVVPGSATGDLAGLTGTVVIARTADGAHTLTLEYELPA